MVIQMMDDNLNSEQVKVQTFNATKFKKEHFEIADHVRIVKFEKIGGK